MDSLSAIAAETARPWRRELPRVLGWAFGSAFLPGIGALVSLYFAGGALQRLAWPASSAKYRLVSVRGLAAGLGAMLLHFLFQAAVLVPLFVLRPSPTPGTHDLTDGDRAQMAAIYRRTLGDEGQPDDELRRAFWAIADRNGLRPDDLSELRLRILGPAGEYMTLLLSDARASLHSGGEVRSPARLAFQERLRASGVMTEAKLKENEEFVRRVAARLPVPLGDGSTAVLDEGAIDQALQRASELDARLRLLHTRP